jgi:hypothetical protein
MRLGDATANVGTHERAPTSREEGAREGVELDVSGA